jgi:hypothetical protein
MTTKTRLTRALLTLCAALSMIPLTAAVARAGTPTYPDVRTMPPSEIRLGTETLNGEVHHLVRFTNKVANAGEGPLELHGTPHFPLDGMFDASQWVYEQPAGVTVEPVGVFMFHPEHGHFHLDDFARYELWSRRDFERAEAKGFRRGQPLYVSPKVSFCLFDYEHVDPSKGPPVPVYRDCTPLNEGLSVGWADVYRWGLNDQWVDVGTAPLPDGDYVIRSIADPSNILYESPGKADPARESATANSAVAYVSIVGGALVQ